MLLGVYLHGSSPFSPKESIEEYIELVKLYENANVNSVWFADHLIRTPDPFKSSLFETWTLIAGLAAHSTNLTFGTMVSPITFRKFGPFIKQVVTTNHLLNGRLILGLGAGWSFKEYSMFGLDFPPTKARLDTLEEWLQAIDLLVTSNESVNFIGNHVQLDQAYLNPKPVNGKLPVLIGGGGENRTLRLVAEYASYSNFGGTHDTIKHKLDVLWNHCDDLGRNRNEIIPTTNQALILGKDKGEVEDGIQYYLKRFQAVEREPPSRDKLGETRLIGTVEEVAQQIGVLKDLGIGKVIMTINDHRTPKLVSDLMEAVK